MAVQQVPNVIQGVSQQAPQQRRDSQCEAQFDCINSAKDGAVARPHFEIVKLWAGRTLTDAFFQKFIREDETYVVGVSDAAPFAINLATGEDCAVTQTADTTYLGTGATAHKDAVRMQAVEDTIFTLNRDVKPAMSATTSAAADNFAYITAVEGDSNNHGLNITLTNLATSVDTVVTAVWDATGSAELSPGVSATAIAAAVNADAAGYSAVSSSSVARIERDDGVEFSVTLEDTFGDWFEVVRREAKSAEKLPPRGFEGDVLKVRGDKSTTTDDYYVKWEGTPTDGKWVEVVGPSVHTTINPDTMPHLLVNTGLNTFEYKKAAWSTRIAGDEETAKDPGFIGKNTRDLFYHASRLAIAHANGVVWSKSRFPYTYFPDTLQTVLAEAPVDIQAIGGSATSGSATLDFAVQVDESLFLWANKVQFRVDTVGNDVFKQSTVEAKVATSYRYARQMDPAAAGATLYFASEAGNWASVRALQLAQGRIVGDIDVTAHVPKYIKGPLRGAAVDETLACQFYWGEGEPSFLYLYNWVLAKSEYVQSAWNTWRVPGGSILWATIEDNDLLVLQQRPEGVALLKANLTSGIVDDVAGAKYLTRLDLRVDQDGVTGLSYSSTEGTTSFTLPYAPGDDFADRLQVVTSEDKSGGFTRGRVFPVTDVSGSTVSVQGDLTGYSFYCGVIIRAEREASKFYLRTEKGPAAADRLTVDSYVVECANTGYTRIEVATPNKDTKAYTFEGRQLDTFGSVTETLEPTDAPVRAPVGEQAKNCTITLINDTYLPSNWQSEAWVYTIVQPGREDYGRR